MYQTEQLGNISLINADCMEVMRDYPDNYFEIAIVDCPYALGSQRWKSTYDGKWHGASKAIRGDYEVCWDDNPPTKEYFVELQRVSKNQIIWGANHFIENIPNANSSCWIVWDKENGANDFADCELAWCSFPSAVRLFRYRWMGMLQGDMKNKQKRIHPTEKPIALYKWLLANYAQKGDKILDTHGGSMASAIAAHELGFEMTCIEIDKSMFDKAKERLIQYQRQLTIF